MLLKTLVSKYWQYGISLIIAVLLYHYISALQTTVSKQSIEITKLNTQLSNRDVVINHLKQKNVINQNALTTLNEEQGMLVDLLDEQEITIERLKNENENLKIWANTALPDDVIRLHSRPKTINNSRDYREHLSESR
jgi:LysB family phage lysis regulatory protein